MSDSKSSSAAPSAGLLRLGMALAALLMLVALGVFYLSLGQNAGDQQAGTQIVISARGCEPNAVTVAAGQSRFTVINESERAIEWEILDGVMVLEERENIAPQLRQPITATLAPGEYQMTCGLLSNPRGTLTVTAVAGQPPSQTLSPKALIGPLAEYRVYLTLQGRELERAAQALLDAIAAGDLAAAQGAYRQARLSDERMAPAIGLFSDLEQRLNARADYFAEREQDPAFIGFQRLAYGLFEQESVAALLPVAEQLRADIQQLRERLHRDGVPAQQLAQGQARVLQAWHDQQRTQTQLKPRELDDLRGLQQGADKVVSLLAPLLPDAAELQQALLALNQQLQQRTPELAALRHDTQALAVALQQVNGELAAAY
ncbi:cupredoxin domain-containing protein [Halopseudomonas sp.]|uniref:cupredoxin domain-containing protein n=1 Tax=Halopseudomonas sp. TaxID=2901191 RepID=UPI00300250F4